VDWDYIFLREDKKLVFEYEANGGKIIAVGAYLDYAADNINRQQLERFTENIINYLTGKLSDIPEYYWSYEKSAVRPFTIFSSSVSLPPPGFWTVKDDVYPIRVENAGDGYVEVAGERILVMGEERSGIEEIWVHPFMAMRDFETSIQSKKADTMTRLTDMIPLSSSVPLR